MSADNVRTADPDVQGAVDADGTEHDDDIPTGEYRAVHFATPDGDETEIAVGDTLVADGEVHGDVREIVHHPDTHHGQSVGAERTAWEWTVYFDYSDGSKGGAPLGELAEQIDDGAEYHGGGE